MVMMKPEASSEESMEVEINILQTTHVVVDELYQAFSKTADSCLDKSMAVASKRFHIL